MTNILKGNIQTQDTQTLIDCYRTMESTTMESHERLVFALITDELENRGILVWSDENEEYTLCD